MSEAQLLEGQAFSPAGRQLGQGAHSIAVSGGGFASAFVDLGTSASATVRVATFGAGGNRLGVFSLDDPSGVVDFADPVVAALPNGTFVVAWATPAVDDDELGIALQAVDPKVGPTGSPIAVNTALVGAQHSPDILWTGTELVVSWTDESEPSTAPDVRYRTFDGSLEPTSDEATLAGTVAVEGDATLAAFNGSWAAAWRSSEPSGLETIRVDTPTGTFSVSNLIPGAAEDKPVLAQIDPEKLLIVFTEGTDPDGTGTFNTARLQYAVANTLAPPQLAKQPISPLVPPYSTDTRVAQGTPTLARAGGTLYVAWRSNSSVGSNLHEEIWLKPLPWSSSTTAFDFTRPERPLQVFESGRRGDQRAPKLVSSVLDPGLLLAGWVDYGQNLPGSVGPDVVLQVRGRDQASLLDPCLDFEQQVSPPFAVGLPQVPDGSASRPYPICTVEQLEHVAGSAALQSKHFVLRADLDLEEFDGALGAVARFTGSFDGDGHILSNFHRALPLQSAVGFIDQLEGDGVLDGTGDGELKNVVFAGATVSGQADVGVAIGRSYTSSNVSGVTVLGGSVAATGAGLGGLAGRFVGRIENSSSSAVVTGSGASATRAGGLVGDLLANGLVTGSFATGGVSSVSSDAGGLVGSSAGTIDRSFATGTVGATTKVGGLVGSTSSSIVDSYARGAVAGSRAGALVGQTEAGTTITRCYATGAATPGTNVGGLSGYQNGTTTYANALWNSSTNPALPAVGNLGTAPSGVSAQTASALVLRQTYLSAGWDFLKTWAIYENDDYPILLTPGFDFCAEVPQQATAPFSTGLGADGTSAKPYPLCTLAQVQTLAATSSLWSKQFRLMGDIDLVGLTSSIGSQATPFSGVFDGAQHRLKNFVRSTSSQGMGLFSYTTGTIKNLNLENFNVSGSTFTGALVGNATGTIQNVHAVLSQVAAPNSGSEQLGGLVGRLAGTISNSTFSGVVTGAPAGKSGGLVGYLLSGSVDGCGATGGVSSLAAQGGSLGGLIGESAGVVQNSFSSALVQSMHPSAGGLIGVARGATSSVLACVAMGPVLSTSSQVGGLVGYLEAGTVSRSVSIGDVAGVDDVGGLVGALASSAALSNSLSSGAVNVSAVAGGGLVGDLGTGSSIATSYSMGAVSGTGNTKGNLIGLRASGATCTAVLGSSSVNSTLGAVGNGSSTGITLYTNAALTNQATYAAHSWDFTSVWTIAEGEGYAELR